ncbi:MAG: class I SAM-dependent methyltransferase [Sandaracinaceae bacterium]
MHDYDSTRRSWNAATRNHNAHKGDQARFLREGGDVLFEDELELLGPLDQKTLAHLQCNAGQDSLCLARRGAVVTGVDLSDAAIAFARELSAETGIDATFVEAELIDWLTHTDARFDLAFASYGATGWLPDLDAWARGVERILLPGGALVYVEFHPIVHSIDADGRASRDDYFASDPFIEPVGDYVAEAEGGLSPSGEVNAAPTTPNETAAWSYQHTMASILDAIARTGLVIERVREYPYSNGCKITPALVPAPGRRFVWPGNLARLPLMLGLRARKPQ